MSFLTDLICTKTGISYDKTKLLNLSDEGAPLFARYDLEAVEFYATLFKNRSSRELARRFMGKGMPLHGCLSNYLDEGKWISATHFELHSSSFRREVWSVDFSDLVTSADI